MNITVNEATFRYPVLGFVDEDVGITGWRFADLDSLTTTNAFALRVGWPAQLELIDADGRRWTVASVRKLGWARSFFRTLLIILCPLYRVSYELAPQADASLSEVQDRVCRVEQGYDFAGYEQERDALIARVRTTTRIDEISPLLDWEDMSV